MEEDHRKRMNDQLSLTPLPVDTSADTLKLLENDTHDEGREHYSMDGVKKHNYREETAAEMAVPRLNRVRDDQVNDDRNRTDEVGASGTVVGIIALIVSIISLFMMPFLLGIIGIIGGFISRSKGATSLGSWAIGIGAISIIVGIFIAPFF